jgi:hypothetical protein
MKACHLPFKTETVTASKASNKLSSMSCAIALFLLWGHLKREHPESSSCVGSPGGLFREYIIEEWCECLIVRGMRRVFLLG